MWLVRGSIRRSRSSRPTQAGSSRGDRPPEAKFSQVAILGALQREGVAQHHPLPTHLLTCELAADVVQRTRRSSGTRRKTSAANENVMNAAATVSNAAFRSGGPATWCRRIAIAMMTGGWKR